MKGRKTGGRQKGTENKATKWGRETIMALLSEYSSSGKMAEDFGKLDPRDRLAIAEKLMQYTIPKMQSTAVELSASAGGDTLESRLIALSRAEDTAQSV